MSKPDGSQKSPTCTTCGQPLPEPVYVGPGDKVKYKATVYKVVGISHRYDGLIVIEGIVRTEAPRVRLDEVTTPDGRPIAGFKDPRDERIAEMEEQWSAAIIASKESLDKLGSAEARITRLQDRLAEHVAECHDLQDQLKRSTNPLAGLTDEQIQDLVYRAADATANRVDMGVLLLRNLRDGKLEVQR